MTSSESLLRNRIRRLRFVVLAGGVLITAGRALDLRWHAVHDEFETGADQLGAHWLAWVGALVLLAAAVVGVRKALYRSPGFAVLLASTLAYAGVAAWHFWLHSQLRDPDLPHVLLAVSQAGLYIGVSLIVAGLVLPRCGEKYVVRRVRIATST